MEIEEAIKHAAEGEAVLFLGAGFSRGAKDISGEDFKDAKQLARYLLDKCEIEEDAELDHASKYFLSEKGEHELYKVLNEKLTCGEVRSYHKSVLTLPWKRIYTTNYDNIIDFVAKEKGTRYHHLTVDDTPGNYPTNGTVCYYINGRLQGGSVEDLGHKIKLTSLSYNRDGFIDSQWADQFRTDIRSAKAVIFVGYSLYDLEISKVLYEYNNLKNKTFFITSTRKSPVRDSTIEPFGTVVPIGVESFSDKIEACKAVFVPNDTPKFSLNSFRKFEIPPPPKRTIDLVDDLLLNGKVSIGAVADSITNERDSLKYFIERESIRQYADALIDSNNKIKNLVIHSGLANGKTLYTIGLSCMLVEAGFNVFYLDEVNDELEREIDYLCSSEIRTLLVIENYNLYRNVIDQIRRSKNSNIHLCLTLRSSIHLLDYDYLNYTLKTDEFFELNIDRLEETEISELVKLCNQSALWGKKAGNSDSEKEREISQKCNANLQPFLLSIIKSPDIDSRVSNLLLDVSSDKDVSKLVILILALEVLQLNPNFDSLAELSGVDRTSFNKLKSTNFATEFLDFEHGRVSSRSSLIAQFLLKEKFSVDQVAEVVLECAKKCHKYWRIRPNGVSRDRLFNNLWKALMKFSQLDLILPSKGKRKAINDFYESIRGLPNVDKEPHFWLQNAISMIAFSEFGKASRFFDNAYDLATNRSSYNTNSIDNSYARFLIERMSKEKVADSFRDFKHANNILNAQLKNRDVDLKYPVRVILNGYQNIQKLVYHSWTGDQKKEFEKICRDMRRSTRNRFKRTGDHLTNQLVLALESIINDIESNWSE